MVPWWRESKGTGWSWDESKVPHWKRAGPFLVDGFIYARYAVSRTFFLTHFHSDHYDGLRPSTLTAPVHGVVYCSQITARLVVSELGVHPSLVVPMALGQWITIDGQYRVAAIDANHCPGAVMFVFEPLSSNSAPGTLLHTGDFRFHDRMPDALIELGVSLPIACVYIDNTYQRSNFPSQDEALRDMIAHIRKLRAQRPRAVFMFSTYTIGKERVLLAVHREFGLPIYVPPAKLGILGRLDLPRFDDAFTTDPASTCFHVVANAAPDPKELVASLQPNASIVLVRATALHGARVREIDMGSVVVLSVPYSEHSSASELARCVRALRPAEVVVTSSQSMPAAEIVHLMRPIDGFFSNAAGAAPPAAAAAASPSSSKPPTTPPRFRAPLLERFSDVLEQRQQQKPLPTRVVQPKRERRASSPAAVAARTKYRSVAAVMSPSSASPRGSQRFHARILAENADASAEDDMPCYFLIPIIQ